MPQTKAPRVPKSRKWTDASRVLLNAVLTEWLDLADKDAREALLPDLYVKLKVAQGDMWREKDETVRGRHSILKLFSNFNCRARVGG